MDKTIIEKIYNKLSTIDVTDKIKEKLGLKLCSISQAIKLGRQCNGFRWTRTDNPTPTI